MKKRAERPRRRGRGPRLREGIKAPRAGGARRRGEGTRFLSTHASPATSTRPSSAETPPSDTTRRRAPARSPGRAPRIGERHRQERAVALR